MLILIKTTNWNGAFKRRDKAFEGDFAVNNETILIEIIVN